MEDDRLKQIIMTLEQVIGNAHKRLHEHDIDWEFRKLVKHAGEMLCALSLAMHEHPDLVTQSVQDYRDAAELHVLALSRSTNAPAVKPTLH